MHQPSQPACAACGAVAFTRHTQPGLGFVGKLWFREGPAQAGQVGTEEARPRRCMECPGRPASQPTTGLNPADRDEDPSQSDAQRAPWSDVRNGEGLVRSVCGLRVAVPWEREAAARCYLETLVPARNVRIDTRPRSVCPRARTSHADKPQVDAGTSRSPLTRPTTAATAGGLIYVRLYYLMVIPGP